MVEEDRLFKTKVKHKGVFDFKETYRVLYEWLVDQGYNLNEKSYKENLGPGGSREIEIEWNAFRNISDYFRFLFKIKWHIMGMTEMEAVIEGEKQKVNKGQFEIEISTILVKDYESRWENRPFFKFLRTMYDRYLIPSRIEQYEGKLLGEMDEFVTQLKSFLSLVGRK